MNAKGRVSKSLLEEVWAITHNSRRTTHDAQRTTQDARRTTHYPPTHAN